MKHKYNDSVSDMRSLAIWLILSAALLGLDGLGLFGFLRRGVERVLIPVERSIYGVSEVLSTPFSALRYYRNGAVRVADLERQVAELTVDSVRVKELEKENEAMRVLLGVPLPKEWTFVPANFISRGDQFSIAAGEVAGVKEGEAVIHGDILVGTVAKVSSYQSIIRPLAHPETRIAVHLPRTGAKGVVTGKFGSQIILTQVLQEEEVSKEDLVVTTGEFGSPKGLVVGKVSEIISKETDVHKEALVVPLTDNKFLDVVFVIKEGD